MSASHANKKGVRYRYYVSQALLQSRKAEASNIARVPAPEIENLVCDGVRWHLAAMGKEPPAALADRELIERHVARGVVNRQALDIRLLSPSGAWLKEKTTPKGPNCLGLMLSLWLKFCLGNRN